MDCQCSVEGRLKCLCFPQGKVETRRKDGIISEDINIAEGRWLMKVRNKRGPRMLPLATHCVTISEAELVPFMRTYCFPLASFSK